MSLEAGRDPGSVLLPIFTSSDFYQWIKEIFLSRGLIHNLSKRKHCARIRLCFPCGHDKVVSSSQKTPSTWEEGQLREALRRSVYQTHISQKGQAEIFISSAEGVMYSKKDIATVRQVLISFSQDP